MERDKKTPAEWLRIVKQAQRDDGTGNMAEHEIQANAVECATALADEIERLDCELRNMNEQGGW